MIKTLLFSISKSVIAVLLVFIINITFTNIHAQTTELKLASDIWPPFTDVTGEKSISIDLVNEALGRCEISSKVEILDFKTVLPGIKSGEFDGSSALWINDERKEYMVFSEPYLYNQLILVGMKGADISATSIDDLKGKKIGVVDNYAYGINSTEIELIKGESDQKNLSRLLSNQIDYMIVDAILIQYLLKYQINDVTEFLEIGSKPLMVKPLYFGISKKVDNAEEMIAAFNNAIIEMAADGTYNKILELNWISADVDGDGKTELVLQGNNAGKQAPINAYGVHKSSLAQNNNTRYYIEGQTYNGWDNVPQKYKNDIVMDSQSLENSGIQLKFK